MTYLKKKQFNIALLEVACDSITPHAPSSSLKTVATTTNVWLSHKLTNS